MHSREQGTEKPTLAYTTAGLSHPNWLTTTAEDKPPVWAHSQPQRNCLSITGSGCGVQCANVKTSGCRPVGHARLVALSNLDKGPFIGPAETVSTAYRPHQNNREHVSLKECPGT
jgi:hypothetical protein